MTKGSNSQTETRDWAREIVEFYDAIVDRVAALREETRRTMDKTRKGQKELQQKLKENLAKGESLRKADFERLMGDVIEKRKEREREVARMLEQFRQEEEEMAQGLRRLLDKGGQVRIKDFKKLLVRLRARQEERRSEVEELAVATEQIKQEAARMVEQFKKEREEMLGAWQTLAQTMQRIRVEKAQA